MAREGIEPPTRGFSGRQRSIPPGLSRTISGRPAITYDRPMEHRASPRTLQYHGVQVLNRYRKFTRLPDIPDKGPAARNVTRGGPSRPLRSRHNELPCDREHRVLGQGLVERFGGRSVAETTVRRVHISAPRTLKPLRPRQPRGEFRWKRRAEA
jgi:hypothetical protein